MLTSRNRQFLLLYFLLPIAMVTLCFIGWQLYQEYGGGVVERIWAQVQSGMKELEGKQKEVLRLRTENARIATENHYYANLVQENPRLREMQSFKADSKYRLQACRVVGRDPSSWWSSVQINQGWADDVGMVSDLPVVSPRGVVGKTGVVLERVTEVILMVNSNCKIASVLESTREQGIVSGDSSSSQGIPQIHMRYIPRLAALGEGERVFTSGVGGVFPAGLLVGTVSRVMPLSPHLNFGLYQELVIDPAVDLAQLDELFVIMGGR